LEQARLIFLATVTAAIVLLPHSDTPSDLPAFPCSWSQIKEGIANWVDHQENSEWCWHAVPEQFQQRCLTLYWSKGLD
jgi:hypothetical protein